MSRVLDAPTMAAPPNGDGQSRVLCELREIGKKFGGTWACRGINLTVRPGEVHALLGENGAGKSTLMKVLHGFHRADEGEILINGQVQSLGSPRDAEAAGIAMIPQELDLFPDLSVCENLFVGHARPRTRFGNLDWRAMRRDAHAIFGKLGVAIDVRTPVRSLSAASAQMVAIARALLMKAQVVLMDEPTAALSMKEADRLFSIVRELCAEGVGVVYITHRLEEVFEHSHRVTVLRDGAWIHTGDTTELNSARLVEMMVGRPVQKLFHRTSKEPGDTVLRVRGLSRPDAFKDISFDLRKGEITALAGLVGAGRSEVAHAVFGIAPATAGVIEVNGKEVRINDPATAIRHKIAYLPEERRSQGLHLGYSSPWNIAFGNLRRVSRFGLTSTRRDNEHAQEFGSMFSIRGDMSKEVIRLSGGNQQKVLLSKILFQLPEIIILDEPTRGVDVGARSEIYRIIDELAQSGKAILLISSELNEVLSMADRILVMYRGELRGTFQGPEISSRAVGFAIAGVATDEARPEARSPNGDQ